MSNKKDKNTILKGIMAAKEAIKQSNFDEAVTNLKQVEPIVKRTKLLEFEFSFLKAFMFDKQEKPKECIESAKNAERLKPNDLNTSRLIIHSYILLKDDDQLATEIISFFKKHSDDEKQDQSVLVEVIAPHLKDLDEKYHEDITLPFIKCIQKLPDYPNLNIGSYIPETDDTSQVRCDLLRPCVKEDQESCECLIELLLYEIPAEERNIDEIINLANLLPPNNKSRLLIETYFGPDPIKSAKMYDDVTSNNKFTKFIDAFESNDLKSLKQQLSYDQFFSSGWVYYGDQVTSLAEKLNAYNAALKSNPKSIPILRKIAQVQSDQNNVNDAIATLKKIKELDPSNGIKLLISFLINHGMGDEADEYISADGNLSDIDRALLSFIHYEKSGNKDEIKFILDLPISPDIAEVRARAIYELRDELGSKAQSMFAECLKQAKENGNVYLYFARWLDCQGLDDKATFIYEKCVNLGICDDVAYDKVTQKLIKEDKLDEALQLCLKVNNKWSHFRAGLILQRQEKHEMACGQFQSEIGINPKNYVAWKALGQSYFILGRVMATLSVVQFLNENGQHDEDLEYQMAKVFEKPIVPNDEDITKSFNIEKTPVPFYSFLSQEITRIKNLSTFGRIETCQLLIERYDPFIEAYQNQWGTLGAVLRLCGEFYLTSFKITKNQKYIKSAITFMQKRCEIDVRPESFIDLSSIFIEMGQSKKAAMILQKVVHKFPDNFLLWTNLGVAFALTKETIPFARHCLCVAAMIATDSESSKVYSFYSAIASMLADTELANRAANEAERARPDDPDVQLLKLILSKDRNFNISFYNDDSYYNDNESQREGNENGEEEEAVGDEIKEERRMKMLQSQLDVALLAFEYGPTPQLIQNIPRLYLELHKPIQALGFSLLSNDPKLICKSYEALGKYEEALTFAQDEETKQRLLALLGRNQSEFEAANFINEHKYQEALQSLSQKDHENSIILEISEAVCLALLDKKEEAAKKLLQIRKKAINDHASIELIESIDRLILVYAPLSLDIGNIGNCKNYKLSFLKQLRKSKGNEKEAAKKVLDQNRKDINAYKLYLISALFNGYNNSVKYVDDSSVFRRESILDNAHTLSIINPCRETYLFLLAAQIKAQMYSIALATLQKLCLMDPNLISKSKDLMKMLLDKNINIEDSSNQNNNQNDDVDVGVDEIQSSNNNNNDQNDRDDYYSNDDDDY